MTNIERARQELQRQINSDRTWEVNRIEEDLCRRSYEMSHNEVRFENGVARWNSNDHAVPTECAVQFEFLNAPIDVEKTARAESEDTAKFIAQYRKQQRNRKPSEEEMFEMRAAFGEGTTVVDVISSRKIRL